MCERWADEAHLATLRPDDDITRAPKVVEQVQGGALAEAQEGAEHLHVLHTMADSLNGHPLDGGEPSLAEPHFDAKRHGWDDDRLPVDAPHGSPPP
ncbi:MAG: hypothetical protein IPN01_35960 [Deltaproteobacteria bacterium]|nr:hypothetical protein [Deltaproteobacteria bacterium]